MRTYSVIYNVDPYQKAQNRTYAQKRKKVQEAKQEQALKKRQMFLSILFLVVLFSIVIMVGCLKTNQVSASSVREKSTCYKTIQVKDGDTLWTLADQYMGEGEMNHQQYIEQVKEMNHLTSDTIESGAYLMIPYTDIVSDL